MLVPITGEDARLIWQTQRYCKGLFGTSGRISCQKDFQFHPWLFGLWHSWIQLIQTKLLDFQDGVVVGECSRSLEELCWVFHVCFFFCFFVIGCMLSFVWTSYELFSSFGRDILWRRKCVLRLRLLSSICIPAFDCLGGRRVLELFVPLMGSIFKGPFCSAVTLGMLDSLCWCGWMDGWWRWGEKSVIMEQYIRTIFTRLSHKKELSGRHHFVNCLSKYNSKVCAHCPET